MPHPTLPKKLPPRIRLNSLKIFPKDPIAFFMDNMKKHPDIMRFKVFGINVYIIQEPQYVKHVLQTNNKNYTKSLKYSVLKQFFGNGLLTSEGDFWRRQRRLAQPAFHRKRLQLLVGIAVEKTQNMLTSWQQQGKNNIDFTKEISQLTIAIVSNALFGTDVHQHIDLISSSMNVLNRIGAEKVRQPFDIPLWIPTPTNRKGKKVKKQLDTVVYGIIENRRNSPKKYDDLLAMLMEASDEITGEHMNDEQLRDEIMTIFVAGYETSVVALSWAMYLLHQEKAVWQKMRHEANEVLQEQNPSFEQLGQLPYISSVINEAMRLYPPAYLIGRRSIKDDYIGDYFLPAKTNVLINTYGLHRHPKYWHKPNTFLPERFLDFNNTGDNKYIYFPFGGGPRKCIGYNFALMEMQVIMAMLVQHFDISLLNENPIHKDPQITLRLSENIRLGLENALK